MLVALWKHSNIGPYWNHLHNYAFLGSKWEIIVCHLRQVSVKNSDLVYVDHQILVMYGKTCAFRQWIVIDCNQMQYLMGENLTVMYEQLM